jgi:2'-5' RNA ligase
MPLAVTLCLDGRSAARASALCRRLAEAGLPDELTRLGYRPHVTLAIYDAADDAELRGRLERYAAQSAPIDVAFTSIGVFPAAEHAAFLAPASSLALAHAHARLLAELGLEPRAQHRPGAWTPHCTLVSTLDDTTLLAALTVLHRDWTKLDATLDRLQLVRFPPVEVLWDRAL